MSKQHISYSELKIFTECPYKWKLQYVDKLKGFTGNIYTAFGSAIHAVCEQSALGNLHLSFLEASHDPLINMVVLEP